jgi:hypothetical protein
MGERLVRNIAVNVSLPIFQDAWKLYGEVPQVVITAPESKQGKILRVIHKYLVEKKSILLEKFQEESTEQSRIRRRQHTKTHATLD